MQLHDSIIKCDQRSQMLLMMLSDNLYKSGWIFNLFLGLSYNNAQKQIMFNDYEWLWRYGIFYKRYIEFPHDASITEIKTYLEKYIGMNYIIGYVPNKDGHEVDGERFILYYAFNASNDKFNICVFYKDTILFNGEKSIYEIFSLYYGTGITTDYSFDILRPINNSIHKFDMDKLVQDIEGKKLHWRDVLFLSENQIKKSLSVFEDWYVFFELRLKWLSGNVNLEKELYNMRIVMNSSKRNRVKLVILSKRYNKLCNMIRSYRCYAENIKEC